jgi:signal transduction histidine kinase
MQGFSEALLEDYRDKLDETGRSYAQHIGSAAKRMDDLIRDLLEYSRLSRTDVRLESVALSQVVAAARQQVGEVLTARGAEVEVADALPSVPGHFGILVQMVANLLDNGTKFVAPGVKPKVAVRTELKDGRAWIWIEDNGIGIAPQFHQKIFRVFERLHAQDSYPGTGIGLAIVRKGAERLGAEVGVESTLGQGARFWIELPPDPA